MQYTRALRDADNLDNLVNSLFSESSATTYVCDLCHNTPFDGEAQLLEHITRRHSDLCSQHDELHAAAAKLQSTWKDAVQSKESEWARWGQHAFEIASKRDGGPQLMRKAQAAREQLEVVVQRWMPSARVFIFGSTVVFGMWDGLSDIDFAVVDVAAMDEGAWPPNERQGVRSIAELLRRCGFQASSVESVTTARVPIIKYHAPAPSLNFASRGVESVLSRSVRYIFEAPLTAADRAQFEAGIAECVGMHRVQQIWGSHGGEGLGLTLDSTTTAVRVLVHSPSLLTTSVKRCGPLHDDFRPELFTLDFDMCFRSYGIRNSLLLHTYLAAHPCARAGALILKDWSKASGINQSMAGYLTSYAINVLWIHFLRQRGYTPHIDPQWAPDSLARINPAGGEGERDQGERDGGRDEAVRAGDEEGLCVKGVEEGRILGREMGVYAPLIPKDLPEGVKGVWQSTLGKMLMEFFGYYCFEFDWATEVVSLNRPAPTTKASLSWFDEMGSMGERTGAEGRNGGNHGASQTHSHGATSHKKVRYVICIEDPYEVNLNLGRHMGYTRSRKFFTELRRGFFSMLAGVDPTTVAVMGGAGGGGGESSSVSPDVLLRLSCVVAQLVDGAPPVGVLSEKVREAFIAEEKECYEKAMKAGWTWEQLIFHVGYKVSGTHVHSRKYIGSRTSKPIGTTGGEAGPGANNEGIKDVTDGITAEVAASMVNQQMNDRAKTPPQWVLWPPPRFGGSREEAHIASNTPHPTPAAALRVGGPLQWTKMPKLSPQAILTHASRMLL